MAAREDDLGGGAGWPGLGVAPTFPRGLGLHPLAELRQQQLEGPELTQRDYQDAARLGAPFKIVDGEVSPFRLGVAKRIGAIQTAAGLPAGLRCRLLIARGCGLRSPGSSF